MIVSERAVVALVKVEGESKEAVDAAFDDLASRVHWSLPKLRFGDVRILDKRVQVRTVSIRGVVGKAVSEARRAPLTPTEKVLRHLRSRGTGSLTGKGARCVWCKHAAHDDARCKCGCPPLSRVSRTRRYDARVRGRGCRPSERNVVVAEAPDA